VFVFASRPTDDQGWPLVPFVSSGLVEAPALDNGAQHVHDTLHLFYWQQPSPANRSTVRLQPAAAAIRAAPP
jgi:hypothetical protein